jgi:hypothetical protein
MVLSFGVFALVLGALVSIDQRVRDRFLDFITGGDGIATWDDRLVDLGGALMSALRSRASRTRRC